MAFRINPELWNGVFAVPNAVADDHIKLAGTVQLKVILWLLRHGDREHDARSLSNDLNHALPDVEDALSYWVERGVLLESANSSKSAVGAVKTAPADTGASERRIPVPVIVQDKPTIQDIARRANENPELKFLFSEAQTQFKRTLSTSEQSNILYIYDYYGLPAEVITMLFEYLSFKKRLTMNNMLKTAEKWAELEVFSIDKAESLMKQSRETDANWREISFMFGMDSRRPTKKEEEYVYSWCSEWKFSKDMIYLAYEENLNKTAKLSFAYINGILKKWNENGIRTPEDAEARRNSFRTKQAEKKNGPDAGTKKASKASYDLKTYDDMLKNRKLVEKYSHLIKDEDGES